MSKELKLSYITYFGQDYIQEVKSQNIAFEQALEELLERELHRRKNKGIERRIRKARFPTRKYLEDFLKEKYNPELYPSFQYLEKLDFIDRKENVILMGTPGCGKTHYATGLGIRACMGGKNVFFISVPNLLLEMREAMSKHELTSYKKRFEKYDLVLLDELGYVSFDQEASEILFQLLSNRNDKASMIVTTNLSFDRWNEVFKDIMLTGAIVDRLAYRAHSLDLSLDVSFRLSETMSWKEKIY